LDLCSMVCFTDEEVGRLKESRDKACLVSTRFLHHIVFHLHKLKLEKSSDSIEHMYEVKAQFEP